MYVFHIRHFYYLRGNKRMKKYDAFPEPIGGYTVGRTQMDFEYTASDHAKRELTAFVYYPSDSSEGKTASAYMFPEVCEMLDEAAASHCVEGCLLSRYQDPMLRRPCSLRDGKTLSGVILCLRRGRFSRMGYSDLYRLGKHGICCGKHRPSE